MSKYDDTKFYWLQLKEDFFDDDSIQWLEEQKPNGRDYAYFYLKLCLKSLKSNGILIRKVGNILIPYDNNKLAELTKMDFDTVTVAMELLKKIGLVQILENGEIYINQLENLIGSKSIGAFKKQQQRLLGGHKADICPPKIEIELDIDKEIESESEKEKNFLYDANVEKINDLFIETIGSTNINNIRECIEYLNYMDVDTIEYALKKTARAGAKWNFTIAILENYKDNNIKTLKEAQAQDLQYKNNKKPVQETDEERLAREIKEMEARFKNAD